MKPTRQLTPLALAALALLVERPLHPYEMYQVLMQRREDRLLKVRPGTLYHTVDRLEADGLVEAVGTEREGNRPERTTYAILPSGRAALDERLRQLLAEPVNEYPSFPLAVAEAHNLPAAVVLDLLDRRLGALRGHQTALAKDADGARAREVPAKYIIDISYQQSVLAAEISWITELCGDIRSGSLAW